MKTRREEVLEHIIRETLWMAKRYADGRRTFAPTIINECIDLAVEFDVIDHAYDVDEPSMHAKDGDFGKWNSELQKFEKEIK